MRTERSTIPVAILAAGASSRMGQHKLLLPLAGRPIIVWAVAAATASRAGDVLVILGRGAEAVKAAISTGRQRAIMNLSAEQGQATSLALAATSIALSVPGLVITLADQPFMDTGAIDGVLSAAEQDTNRIAMGVVGNQPGHPVYLPRRLFADITALGGDTGAREIIQREQPNITRVPLMNLNAQFDVDTPTDYTHALALAYLLGTAAS